MLIVFRSGLLRVGRAHLGYLAIYGLVPTIFNGLWTVSVALNGGALSAVLVYSSAGFAVLLRLLLQERLNWGRLLAVMISLGVGEFVSGAADEPLCYNCLTLRLSSKTRRMRLAIPVQPKLRRAKRAPSADISLARLSCSIGIASMAPNSSGRSGSA